MMNSFWGRVVLSIPAVFVGMTSMTARGAAREQGEVTSVAPTVSTSLVKVTSDTYRDAKHRGAVTLKNVGTDRLSTFTVVLYVPGGEHCLNEGVPKGATLSPLDGTGKSAKTASNRCEFTWSDAKLAPGRSISFRFATEGSTARLPLLRPAVADSSR